MTTDRVGSLPITGLPSADLPQRVLVVGDPARARAVADRFEDRRVVATKREYHSYTGTWRGVPVVVVSHGVGSAGAAACFTEVARAGASRIIRAGTCGGLQPGVTDGDLVVVTGAVRDDGFTRGVVPVEFPAIAHPDVVAALRSEAGDSHLGIVLTSDVFYPFEILGSNLTRWHVAGCVAVEMECAALFVVAALTGMAAGAVLTVDGNPLAAGDTGMQDYDPDRSEVRSAVERMIDVALAALVV